MSVKTIALACSTLLLAATSAPSFAKDPVPPLHPVAKQYLGETLVLLIPDELAIPMTLHRNGTVSYVDIHTYKDGLKSSYVRTVPFEIRNDKILCILKETQPCFELPALKSAESKVVDVIEYEGSKVVWTGKGEILLAEQR
ncbi:MAG: hypothetical protein ACRCY3_15445 [Sphingorhabdus sp.]